MAKLRSSTGQWISDRCLYLSADGLIVEESDVRQATQLVGRGGPISDDLARKYELSEQGGLVVYPGCEGAPEPTTKERAKYAEPAEEPQEAELSKSAVTHPGNTRRGSAKGQ